MLPRAGRGGEEAPARAIALSAGCTALAYLGVGLPLAVLPVWVVSLGYGATVAGVIVSVQYLATIVARLAVGPMIDRSGPRRAIVTGFLCCLAAGGATIAASFCSSSLAALAAVAVGRVLLGAAESLVSTSAMAWGIMRLDHAGAARMISWNGIATYGAIAAGAPIGAWVFAHGGVAAMGAALLALGAAGIAFVLPQHATRAAGEDRRPIGAVFAEVLPFGGALALASAGFGAVVTFVPLLFAARRWPDAWLAVTALGVAFILSRLLFVRAIDRFGGLPVAAVFLAIEAAGLAVLFLAGSSAIAIAGAALAGFGFAMIFPALGVLVIARVGPASRGTAIGTFSMFIDVALLLSGPAAGAIAERAGQAAPFAAAAACAGVALGIVAHLLRRASAASRNSTRR